MYSGDSCESVRISKPRVHVRFSSKTQEHVNSETRWTKGNSSDSAWGPKITKANSQTRWSSIEVTVIRKGRLCTNLSEFGFLRFVLSASTSPFSISLFRACTQEPVGWSLPGFLRQVEFFCPPGFCLVRTFFFSALCWYCGIVICMTTVDPAGQSSAQISDDHVFWPTSTLPSQLHQVCTPWLSHVENVKSLRTSSKTIHSALPQVFQSLNFVLYKDSSRWP